MTTAVGIDPSFTRTGVAIIRDGEITLKSIEIKAVPKATLVQKCDRVFDIALALEDYLYEQHLRFGPLGHYAIEGPAFGATNASAHYLSGLWWRLAEVAVNYDLERDAKVVQPTSLKMYATGRGNAGKDQVLLEVARRYGHLCTVENNDQADALVLAAIAWHLATGEPLVDLPDTHTRALDKLR